jgi:DNA-directed RNA polymerase III subunit RPC1
VCKVLDSPNVNCYGSSLKLIRWLGDHGFSIGIPDVQPSSELTDTKIKIVTSGYNKCQDSQKEYKQGKLVASPGSTLEQELEVKINVPQKLI